MAHIDPKTQCPDIPIDLWNRLDSIVKTSIYGTISSDVLQTVFYRRATAHETWKRLQSIFHDNKHTRIVYLENQFNALHLSNFPHISAYCKQLKHLKDQLANVNQIVSKQKLVLCMAYGLFHTNFDTVASLIQLKDPLPSF